MVVLAIMALIGVDRRIGGLENMCLVNHRQSRVDRRIGGLEIGHPLPALERGVDRRIGGLEMPELVNELTVYVDRRIGGLEISCPLTMDFTSLTAA